MIAGSHAAVANYLDDVARMLTDLDPAERAEVLAGLREHLDGALDPDGATDDDIHRVLTDLGPPDAVAREALAGTETQAAPRTTTTAHPPPHVPLSGRPWVPSVTVALLTIALGLSMLALFAGAAFVSVTTSSQPMDFAPPAPTPAPGGDGFHAPELEDFAPLEEERTSMWPGIAGASLGAALFSLPLWGSAAVLLLVSPLFTTRIRALGTLLVPLSVLVVVGGAGLAGSLISSDAQPWSLLVTGPAVVALTVLTMRAILRSGRSALR